MASEAPTVLTLHQTGREVTTPHHTHTPYHKPETHWYLRRDENVCVEIDDEEILARLPALNM
jgi:hypothetical protein